MNDPGGFRLTHYWLKEHVTIGYIRKDNAIKKLVGLSVSTLLEKLEDATLDHIHHRRLRRYLVDAKKRLDEQVEKSRLARQQRAQDAQIAMQNMVQGLQNAVQNPIPAIPIGEPVVQEKKERLVGCPILQMGYAGIECQEKMPKSKVLEHLAGHVATLMKRVKELEQDMDTLRHGGNQVVNLDANGNGNL